MEFGTRNYTNEQVQVVQAAFMSKVYSWMSGGLAITGLIAMWVASIEGIELMIQAKYDVVLWVVHWRNLISWVFNC